MGRITEIQALWAVIAVIIGIDAVWAWSIGMRVTASPVLVSCMALLSGIGFVYANIRPNRPLAVLATTSAQFFSFTAAGATLSYLTATSRLPLVDHYLAAGDSAVGFDWLSSFNWIQNHKVIDIILGLSYASALPQIVVLMIVLVITGRLGRMREFLWLFVLTLLIIIPSSWLMPAEGAWAYYGVTHLVDAYYLPHFNALRDGEMHEIVLAQIAGIIQFPSFHAALALIFIYASWGIRILFPVYIGLNVLMIVSTPAYGGHHLTDILAGMAVVPLSIFILWSWQS